MGRISFLFALPFLPARSQAAGNHQRTNGPKFRSPRRILAPSGGKIGIDMTPLKRKAMHPYTIFVRPVHSLRYKLSKSLRRGLN